jgi:geranylgeranyl reductase family protein
VVALFERRAMPRTKPCGGGLSVRAMAHLDFPIPPELVDSEIHGTRIGLGAIFGEARLERLIGVLVTRSKFDHFMLKKAEEAGAQVLWQEVKSLEVRPDGVVLQTPEGEVTARCAILCEGTNRRLSLAVRPADTPRQRAFCLEADVPVPQPDPFAALRDMIDVRFGYPGRGYGWVFHHGTYYSVGVGGVAADFKNPREVFDKFVAGLGLDMTGVRVWGHFIPAVGLMRPMCADRLLVAGDAAGCVDPFQGEGLSYAIRSGQLAADTALAAAARNDFSRTSLAGYERRCAEAFGRDLRIALFLSKLTHLWPSLFTWLLAADPEVLRRYLQVAATELSYRFFLRRLILKGPWRWLKSRLRLIL